MLDEKFVQWSRWKKVGRHFRHGNPPEGYWSSSKIPSGSGTHKKPERDDQKGKEGGEMRHFDELEVLISQYFADSENYYAF